MDNLIRRTIPASLLPDLANEAHAALTIHGDHGGTVLVTGEVYHSNLMPQMIVAETEHGSLYLSNELEVDVSHPA